MGLLLYLDHARNFMIAFICQVMQNTLQRVKLEIYTLLPSE